MSRIPKPGAIVGRGPFEREAEARAVPAVRAVYAAEPGHGNWQALNHRIICDALSAAGVEVGAYDHRVIVWVAGFEPQMCAVVAGLIARAHAAGSAGAR
jgi:hypothetical protein